MILYCDVIILLNLLPNPVILTCDVQQKPESVLYSLEYI